MKLAGCVVDGRFRSGYLCYGIPVGEDEYVRFMLDEKVKEVKNEVGLVKDLLGPEDGQAVWTILHCSLAQKLDYHLSLCYPSDIAEAAKELDSVLWDLLEYATGLHIPRCDEGLGVECMLDLPYGMLGRSFQELLVRQPVKLGGLGLRSMVETSYVAFVGGVEMALPFLTGDQGICPMLEEVI